VTNAFTLETSMFAKKLRNKETTKEVTSQLTIKDFDNIGQSLVKSILNYTILERQLEKEYKNTGGWLHKKKLDEVTGETARKKQEQSIKKRNNLNAKRSQSNYNLVVETVSSSRNLINVPEPMSA